jgi:hypothetical protein
MKPRFEKQHDHGGPLPMGPQPMNCMGEPREYLQQHDGPSLNKNGFFTSTCIMMLPVGEKRGMS